MKLHWGNAIFIFFVIFISLSIAFIVFAVNQDNELVEDDYYNKGANYTEQMRIKKRSLVFNDSISIDQNTENLILHLAPSLTNSTDSLRLHFYNPSSKSKDYKILLSDLSNTNIINKSNFFHGRYILKLEWIIKDEVFQVEKGININ